MSWRSLVPLLAVLAVGTPTLAADGDGDGLRDAFERRWGITEPDDRDSDGDGVIDSAEDSDHDRVGNLGEQRYGTDPGDRDTDGDGRADGREDHDRDGRDDATEQDQRPLPASLVPSLAEARSDVWPHRDACQSSWGDETLTVCEFGTPGSDITVALVGDSHATMVAEPIRRVVDGQGWRFVTLLKGACPPILGVHGINQHRRDGGRSCRRWRLEALEWLASRAPDVILLAHSDEYTEVSLSGMRIPGPRQATLWATGVAKTLGRLSASSRVSVLRDVPLNEVDPVHCLRRHGRDISACVTPRERPARRDVQRAIKQAAIAHGARYWSVYGQVCSYDPCPVIQGSLLMWRDQGHHTETFAEQLTPTFRRLLLDAVPGPARRRR